MLALVLIILACPPSYPLCPPCEEPGLAFSPDWDESGTLDGDDLGDYLNDWSAQHECSDLDGSGECDGTDLCEFLEAYFGA